MEHWLRRRRQPAGQGVRPLGALVPAAQGDDTGQARREGGTAPAVACRGDRTGGDLGRGSARRPRRQDGDPFVLREAAAQAHQLELRGALRAGRQVLFEDGRIEAVQILAGGMGHQGSGGNVLVEDLPGPPGVGQGLAAARAACQMVPDLFRFAVFQGAVEQPWKVFNR